MCVRGYDYGPKFKLVEQIEFASFERTKSLVHWENNFITFVESMIQLMVSHTDQRLIFVAGQLPLLKCDPKLFYHLPAGNVPVITDSNLEFVASNGIEMKGLKFVNIPLRNVMENVKMEKYEFVPFDEPMAIETIDLNDLKDYVQNCELLFQVIKQAAAQSTFIFNDKLNNILKQNPNDNQVLLKILIQFYRTIIDENGNVIGDGKINWPTAQKIITENEFDLSKDILNCCHKNDRLMRSTLDVVNENGLRNLTIVEANYNGQIMIDNVISNMSAYFHYPLVVDYLLTTKSIKAVPEELQKSANKLINWDNVNNSKLPLIESPADLFLFKDSFDLFPINLELFTKELFANIKEGGFLFAVFRSQISNAEKMIYNFIG